MIELEPLLQDVTTLALVTVADGPAAGQGAAGSDGRLARRSRRDQARAVHTDLPAGRNAGQAAGLDAEGGGMMQRPGFDAGPHRVYALPCTGKQQTLAMNP
jgi:hypothetical protein